MSSTATTNTPIYKKMYFKVISIVLIIYCLIWLLSSPLITYFAKEPLAEMGLVLSPESTVRFNPFLTRVTITEFSWLKDEKNVFDIQSLALQVALHKVLFDIIEIEELSINGITIDVEKDADKLFVAGIDLSSTESDEEEKTPEESEEPLPYKVLLKSLAITNINVNALLDKNPHTYKITELYINNIEATQIQQSANIKLLSLFNDAPLNLNASLAFNNGEGLVESDILINKFPLTTINHLVEPLKQLSGTVTFSSKQTITLENDEVKVAVTEAELLNNQLLVNTEDNTIKLDDLALNLNDLSLSLINNELNSIKGIAQLSLKNANIFGKNNTQVIASFTELNIKNIVPSLQSSDKSDNNTGTQSVPKVSIDALTISNLLFSQNKTNELPAVATVKQIIVDNIIGDENSVAINTINVDSLTSHVILNKEKALANLVALTSESEIPPELDESAESESTENNTSTTAEKTPDANPFLISLNEFNLINSNDIFFVDNSVNPIYERTIMIDKLSVGALSNHENKKEDKTPIAFIGRSNQYANFDFGGFIQPFAEKQTYHVKGNLKELSLLSASTYMKDALELGLTSGQLNTDVDVTLAGEDIEGDIVLNIKGLETGATVPENNETGEKKGQVSFSLNTALAMLKDDTGNIELEIPLSGKTSDPSFGLSSIIGIITKKAIITATETYLVKTLVPGGNLVSVAMLASDIIMKQRFEDLPYQPTQAKLNEKQTEYVQKFIALMKNKKGAQVKLCAVSTPSDIGLVAKSKLSESDIKKLKALAIKRENNFKTHVVEQGIESGRILLCAPEIDNTEGAIPRMGISV